MAIQSDHSEVGNRVRAARARIGMTRKQLAAASGASERYLAQIEAGDGNPSLSVLTALAGAFDMAVAELLPLGGEQEQTRANTLARVRHLPAAQLSELQHWLEQNAAESADKAGRVVLIGLRGAGKTALGAALAKRMNLPFIEVSKRVEESYGADIGALLELGGQPALRRLETEVWEELVAAYPAAVIAAPGGVAANVRLFDRIQQSAHSVWLQASPEDHMARVVAQGDMRPMAGARGAMVDLKAILAARTADYGRADLRLDTSAQGFNATLTLLTNQVRSLLASQ